MKKFLFLAIAVLAIGCSKKGDDGGGGSAAGPSKDPIKEETVDYASSLRYYKGGFMVVAPAPNWKYDYTMDFTKWSTEGFKVTAEYPDVLCHKGGVVTQAQIAELSALITALQLKKSDGPIMADGGVETLEVVYKSGAKWKYHLMDGEVPKDELVAINPAAISKWLQDFDATLATACQ